MRMAFLRLFTAICPPSPAVDRICDTQNDLRRLISTDSVRWVIEANLHLTLQFFGDVDTGQVDAVKECMKAAVEECDTRNPIPLAVVGVGAFPNATRARVIWTGVDDLSGRLNTIDRALRQQLRKATVAFDEKPFRPHITLGYVRRRAAPHDRRDIAQAIHDLKPETVSFFAESLCLIQSTLSSDGARYANLYSVGLAPESSATSSGDNARE